MRARYHGEQPAAVEVDILGGAPLGAAPAPTVGFMFGDLTDDPANRLPEGPKTIRALIALGATMAEDPSRAESGIPAAYTYFGQFIDHDITKTVFEPEAQLPGFDDPILVPDLRPIPRAQVDRLVRNDRNAHLDLDSVYEGLAKDGAIDTSGECHLGEVSPSGFGPIPTADRKHDLPRRPLKHDPTTPQEQEEDRQALIGDPRNDENLLVAQLHVAFLRSHNVLLKRFGDFEATKREVRRRYQWAVLHDFLPRVADKTVVKDVFDNGPRFWIVEHPNALFMPLEFSVAAYRFGHSMIRGEYDHNATFSRPPKGRVAATFNFFFTFTALSGDLQPGAGPDRQFATLPDNWPIEWHRFFEKADGTIENVARRIDANLTPELGNLRDFQGLPIVTVMGRLAARNLLRGYLLGLPTGQAVARLVGAPPLSAEALRRATPSGLSTLLKDAELLERTPLWFYVLAEAGDADGPDGQHLGEVGSRILAETFWNLTKHSADNVIDRRPTDHELDSGEFTLKGFVKIGQDAGMPRLE